MSSRLIVAFVAVVVLVLLFNGQSDGNFLSSRNLSLLLREAALVAILAGGVAIVMIMGEIDLSIGSAVYFAGILAAMSQVDWGFPPLLAVLLAVGFGVALGLWHTFWVVKVGVPSFIVTLTSLLALRGLGLQLSDGKTIGPLPAGYIGLSESFLSVATTYGLIAVALVVLAWHYWRQRRIARALDQAYSWLSILIRLAAWGAVLAIATWSLSGFLGTPTAALWIAAAGILLAFLMARTTFGRNAYMIGANREASRLAGIGVGRHLLIAFVIMGVLYGVGGVLLTTRLGASAAGTGQFLELEAIAAAVIGGVSLRGGIGTVSAAIGGAFLLTIIDNGMQAINLSSFLQDVVKGAILLLAVAADAYTQRPRTGGPTLMHRLRAQRAPVGQAPSEVERHEEVLS
ncbi:sugar ABC transporter permease [Actinomadura madurae]|uniref:sugar ABC transporter permease n=1 Tax=Actinomadura madurae TaxID=1993 RepID=UPI0015EF115D|nr:sugar ABC transporter permease [Actinomadura madurae]